LSIENELYERWKNAPEGGRHELEQEMYRAVRAHASAVVWSVLGEYGPDLAQDIASDVIRGIPRFRGDSQFSTWVHRIALNHVNSELRRRTRERDVFDYSVEIDAGGTPDLEERLIREVICVPDVVPSLTVGEIARKLSPDEGCLFQGMCEGKDQNELAVLLGIGVAAAESRRRRFVKQLRRKYSRKL
jgi:RNA polymerase sigma-70 factor, ECF subfamily